jgi:hypothetical protein
MTVFVVIPPGDIELSEPNANGKRSVILVSGAEYVKQKIASRLRFFLGEWFLDQRLGIPYFRDVLGPNPQIEVVRSIFRQVILSVQEVAAINRLDLDYNKDERTVAVAFECALVEGGVLDVRQPDPLFIIQVQRVI